MNTKNYDLLCEEIYKGYKITQKLAHGENAFEITITNLETNEIVAELEKSSYLVGRHNANKFIDEKIYKENREKLLG